MNSTLSKNFETALGQILQEACGVGQAERGVMRVYNAQLDRLQILVQRGFDPAFLQVYQLTRLAGTSASVRAFQLGKRVLIPDVAQDPFYIPYLATAEQLGVRAVQATPILDKQQKVLGVLTTNFTRVVHLSRAETQVLDECAVRAAYLMRAGWLYQTFG